MAWQLLGVGQIGPISAEWGPEAMQQLRRRLGELVRSIERALAGFNRRLGGIPSLLKATFDSYNAHDGTLVSAAMAYYFFFTLFPLALALIAIGSLFFRAEDVRVQVVNLLVRVIPISREVVVSTINQVVAQAGAIGVLATLSFIYAASGLFGLLLHVVSRVWQCPRTRPSIIQRLLAIGLVLGFAVVIFLVSVATTSFEALISMQPTALTAEQIAALYTGISVAASLAVTAGLFLVLYWQLPATRVYFADAWPAALLVAAVWEGVRELYGWYVSRFTHYTLVYGSLAAIIGLLAWFYLTAFIILLGVELSAQIANRRGRGPAQCAR